MASMGVLLKNRAVIKITGADRHSFLQGLVTNDVHKLKIHKILYTLFLNPRGRFQFDFFMIEIEDAIYITPELDHAVDLLKKLSFYKLHSNVHLERIENWGMASIFDLSQSNSDINFSNSSSINVFPDPRLKELGLLIIGSLSDLNVFINTNAKKVDLDVYQFYLMSLGVPNGSQTMPINQAIPLEYNMEYLYAIDWQKGCYLGQELTARTHYVGEIRKRLLPVLIKGESVPFDTLLFSEDQEVGKIRNSLKITQDLLKEISDSPVYGLVNKDDEIGLALIKTDILQDLPLLTINSSFNESPVNKNITIITPFIPGWLKNHLNI